MNNKSDQEIRKGLNNGYITNGTIRLIATNLCTKLFDTTYKPERYKICILKDEGRNREFVRFFDGHGKLPALRCHEHGMLVEGLCEFAGCMKPYQLSPKPG